MTATDELRRMLDERGVEWMPSVWSATDETFYKVGEVGYLATEMSSGRMKVGIEGYLTPEQAIAATLGSSNCSNNCTNSERTGTCHNAAPSYLDFLCSECGFVHYHSDENDSGDGNEWHYCPNCGARVGE